MIPHDNKDSNSKVLYLKAKEMSLNRTIIYFQNNITNYLLLYVTYLQKQVGVQDA